MIEHTSGDILRSDTEALVNTVNCVGVMGRGIALQFKQIFPANFEAYAAACKRQEVQPGRMFVFDTGQLTPPRYIINFPTKRHWRGKSRMEDIDAGLVALVATIRERGIRSIAIPPLGSGLGGLDWAQVRPRIESALGELEGLRVMVFEPGGAPAADTIKHQRDVPKMTPGRAALVELLNRYLRGLLDPFVTLLEAHKLMYFMQEAGQPLRLRYKQAPYGPYAENLRHVLREIEGYLISGYADGGDAPDKQLQLVPGAAEEAEAFLSADSDTRARFERVAELVQGFETPFGLELLATVHWVMTRQGAASLDAVVEHTYAWNDRKRQFTPRQIGIAVDCLTRKGWVTGDAHAGVGREFT
ncbi:MAG: macro domain-containing protein [Chromatiaceae bacterium]|nr:macro domain-containing protein [Chromatiaceae bacterium]